MYLRNKNYYTLNFLKTDRITCVPLWIHIFFVGKSHSGSKKNLISPGKKLKNSWNQLNQYFPSKSKFRKWKQETKNNPWIDSFHLTNFCPVCWTFFQIFWPTVKVILKKKKNLRVWKELFQFFFIVYHCVHRHSFVAKYLHQ